MGWSSPRTYTVGEIITKSILDTHVKDNLRYLKGLDGVPTIESGLIIDNAGGDEYLQIPSLTTTERDLLTPVNGMVIYNETTTEFNKYEAGAWVDLADNTDHGGLDGLGDDDHTQYQKEDLLTTQGDMAYATAASTWARLPKGTAGQQLIMGGANIPEWGTGVFPQYGIIMWAGTIANIPSGFVICDGNNSTPNWLARFIEGVATAATDPGTTGGATSKKLVVTNANVGVTGSTGGQPYGGTGGTLASAIGSVAAGTGSDFYGVTISDIRPLFYDAAFIQKT